MTKMGRKDGVKLSKAVLEMKFMKRTKERLEREAIEAQTAALVRPREPKGSMAPVEPSMAACMRLRDGRLSFGGFNPHLERLIELESQPPPQEGVDISDKQMADFYTKKRPAPPSEERHNKKKKKRFM